MRFSGLLYFYARRLRASPVQEMLAGIGIAIGVALVFAVQVANSSIIDASSTLVRGIAGTATLQLRARDSSGFSEHLLDRVQRLPGVSQAAPVLDQSASLIGRDGRRVAVDLASASPSLLALEGRITRSISRHNLAAPGLILPSATARALGLPSDASQALEGSEGRVVVEVRGRARQVSVIAVLGPETIGSLSGARAAIAPQWFVQKITGLSGRVTRILVTPKRGKMAVAERALTALAAGKLEVAPADQDIALLKQALKPETEVTGFFALVSAIVGLLLTFSAMLLTVPERRRVIADLRMQGVRPWQLIKLTLFQAVCLGVLASLLGLLVGDVLSRTILHTTPSYLAAAFPLGTQTVIGIASVLISFLGGVVATCLAATPPLFDLRRRRAVDAVYFEDGEPGQALDTRAQVGFGVAGAILLVLTSGVLVVFPSAIVVATIGLAVATLLVIPLAFRLVSSLAGQMASHTSRLNMLALAVRALRGTTVRSLALAATGAIAVFGCVVAEGSHSDLLQGLYRDYSDYVSTADLWVLNSNDDLATSSYATAGLPRRIAAVPGVIAVRSYRGGFLDFAGRRVWIIARDAKTPAPIPASQLEEGDLAVADRQIARGGWIAVSRQIADSHHVGPGGTLTLPTPTGLIAYRVAATTTNLGWSPGAIILNGTDYRRSWGTTAVSALEVRTRSQASNAAVRRAIQGLLGPASALTVQTGAERAAQADALDRQGLSRMSQITLLLMIAAALAMAAAMGGGIWQRRVALASLRINSYSPWQLRGVLVCESLLVLGTGALVGAAAGIYGHLLSDRFLRLTTGFPAPFAVGQGHTVQTILVIVVGALAALTVPGFFASQAPHRLALQD